MKTIIAPEKLVLAELQSVKASIIKCVANGSDWMLDARGVIQTDASGIQLILAVINHHKAARVLIQPGSSIWDWIERLSVTQSVTLRGDGSLVSNWSNNL